MRGRWLVNCLVLSGRNSGYVGKKHVDFWLAIGVSKEIASPLQCCPKSRYNLSLRWPNRYTFNQTWS